MASYCFDQYDYPLLWCDQKKKIIERRNAEESLKLWRRKKAEEMERINREKEETLRSSALPPCRVNIPSGTTTQIKSATGDFFINLNEHQAMSFRNKGHFDIELRYKPSPMNKKQMQLDKVIVTEKPQSQQQKGGRKSSKRSPSDKEDSSDTSPKKLTTTKISFVQSLGCTNKELIKNLNVKKSPSSPEINDKKSKKHKTSPAKDEMRRCCSLCTCKCPMLKSTTKNSAGLKNYSPGKIKSAAKENDVKICPRYTRELNSTNFECKPKNVYKNEKNVKIKKYVKHQGVEILPLLETRHRKNGAYRPITLSSTDVTKCTSDKNRSPPFDAQHLDELKRQVYIKKRRGKLYKDEEQKLCAKHFETFDKFWGRPGHGAPTKIKYKLNLDDLLYNVPAMYSFM